MLETLWTFARPWIVLAWAAGFVGFVWALVTTPYTDKDE